MLPYRHQVTGKVIIFLRHPLPPHSGDPEAIGNLIPSIIDVSHVKLGKQVF